MSAYDRNRRYLLCEHCGAPVEVQPRAGSATCGHCRAPLEVRMRPEAAVAPPTAGSEPERLALLVAQERRFVPPPDVAVLLAGDRVAPAKENQAWATWTELRRQVGEEEAARRLFLLTLSLAETLFERQDLLRQRALTESALAVLTDPSQRQVLHALLARSALRAGDAQAAEAWIALCNPRSEDLLADTAYRFARAYLDTASGALSRVLLVLGAGDVPLSDAYGPECAVLCANAWERMGELEIAAEVLVMVRRDLGPLAHRRVIRFIQAHAAWQLCPRSLAEAQRRAEAMEPMPMHGGQVAGLLLTLMGVYCLVWAAGGVVLPLAGVALGFDSDGLGWGIAVVCGGLVGLMTLPFGINVWRLNKREHTLRLRGTSHVAHVLSCTQLERPVEGSIPIDIELLVTPDDAPAHRYRTQTMIVARMQSNFAVGSTLIFRVDPKDAARVQLEVPVQR